MSIQSSQPGLKRIVPKSIRKEVTAQLAQLVVSSEPGTRLPTERELSEMLSVGRSSVREAMRALAFVGAVHIKQGDGIYVAKVRDTDVERHIGLGLLLQRSSVAEVIEARRLLEIDAVALAAERHDENDKANLEAVMAQLVADAHDANKAAVLDLEFHIAIARASRNGVLLYFLNGMRGLIRGWIESKITHATSRDVVSEIIEEHQALLNAIFSRDAKAAAQCMEEHMYQSARRLIPAIEQSHATPDHVFNLLSDR